MKQSNSTKPNGLREILKIILSEQNKYTWYDRIQSKYWKTYKEQNGCEDWKARKPNYDEIEKQITSHFKAEYAKRLLSEDEIKEIINDLTGVVYLEKSKNKRDRLMGELRRNNNDVSAKAISDEQKRLLEGL